MKKYLHADLLKIIASSNVNFLIGSGLSSPFLDLLNNIEERLDKAEKENKKEEVSKLRKEYFEKCMVGNLLIVEEKTNKNKDEVLSSYKNFYKSINQILLKREDSILTKQVNIFTTNIDIYSEKALENTGIEFNDGFSGRFNPIYSSGNFKKSYIKKSLHYEKTSELPIFNILKLHGSVTWKSEKNGIVLDKELSIVKDVQKHLNKKTAFTKAYDNLMIVNPTERKFQDTVLNQYYYDLLRIYSNELEKENCVLFVMGFSFNDSHIRNLTMQVSNSNPTLVIYIFSYEAVKNVVYENMKNDAKNKNIFIVYPENGINNFNLNTITIEVFDKFKLNENVYQDNLDNEENNVHSKPD